MRHSLSIPALTATLLMLSNTAEAACQAEFKAKRDNPLTLVYQVVQVDAPCTVESARIQLEGRLAGQGLTLLKILSVSNQ